ncbi:bone morphogenetic protein 2-like [Pecten maximus]|uniref:bone morphogenetic protein 2-like n=1 Tax=Pecten maximus TaxID=6579 RepID=UPI001458BB37|nr:bone morphogenetic protein 2-like [Pecten maximus]
MFEVMRNQDTDLSRRIRDENFSHKSAREAIHFLNPQFGNFGRRLYFNLSSIPTNVNITRAEMVFSSPNSDTEINGITIQDSDPAAVLHGSSTSSGYKIDVSDVLDTEISSAHSNLVVNVQLQQPTDVRFRSRDRRVQRLRPMLAVFENIDTEPFMRTNSHARDRRSSETDGEKMPGTSTESDRCHLQPWILEFSKIGLQSVIFPTSYEANICVGSCDVSVSEPSMHSTNYAYMKNLYRKVIDYTMTNSVPTTCCTPMTYQPISVIYLDKSSDSLVVERVENMKVSSCGCP